MEDILHEIEGQLAFPLEEQREKAIAYVSKKEQLEDVEPLFSSRNWNIKCSVESSSSRREQLQEQLAQTEATLETLQVDEENQVNLKPVMKNSMQNKKNT